MSNVFDHRAFDDHEQVIFVTDKHDGGLRGIIAIHNTALGPAAGGCRMYPYTSIDDALNDVLRLSRGMTMKNSAADLPLGGGKCVILADPTDDNKAELLRAMAKQVQSLGGRFWTAIDVGVSSEDADWMAEHCDYIFARASEFEPDFQPADFTALGGFHAVRAVSRFLRDSDDLSGLRVAVQGVGQTGSKLVHHLLEHNAEAIVTDTNEQAVANVVDKYSVQAVAPNDIFSQDVDIFAPCAMGGILNDETISELRCKGIAGLANNQLEHKRHGQMLVDREISYAPDFVANAGGVMGASMPIFSKPNKQKSLENVAGIYESVLDILRESARTKVPTEEIAERIAQSRITKAREDAHNQP